MQITIRPFRRDLRGKETKATKTDRRIFRFCGGCRRRGCGWGFYPQPQADLLLLLLLRDFRIARCQVVVEFPSNVENVASVENGKIHDFHI
jgi:hypothetical protein